MGLIFWLSSIPDLPGFPSDIIDRLIKKTSHMVEYGILGGLAWRALHRISGRASFRTSAASFLLAILYSVSDEFHQTFVPGRDGNPWDVCIDGLGITIGLALVWLFGQRSKRRADR